MAAALMDENAKLINGVRYDKYSGLQVFSDENDTFNKDVNRDALANLGKVAPYVDRV